MHRLWMIFAQAVTISVAVLFVLSTLKPEWVGERPMLPAITIQQAAAPAATPSGKVVASYADAARAALPSVVHIFTSKEVKSQRSPFADDPLFRHFFGDRLDNRPQQRASGLGSGVVVSPEGYILTNNHVIEAADEIEVALNDGRKLPARIVGRDPESDLAVLQVKPEGKLHAITFGHTEQLSVGDVVLAIGNPFGVGQTVTMGIVSALGRSHLGINTFEDFIQTDAAINPGNSGGALVDAAGNLVGINAAIYSRSGGSLGIGFAIPVSLARNVMEQIIQNGSVTRGWIGVEVQAITPELAESFSLPSSGGTLISGVMRGSPADRAGVKPGDVLLAVEGRKVNDPQAMLEAIAALAPGRKAGFELRRGKEKFDVRVEIGRRPALSRGD
ncbi:MULTISPECIES: Do family serine endopeptidase [Zoogloea]|jgi:serine protease DegS/serine protease DegQ|uniref:Do family serine endopeptidase n=1 Tax=Zoogloea TaxID=349 RepID=UPI00258D60E5|nr:MULTISPECIES: Do family serine endopeptidase [Zoogloea]MBT9496429.1 Do family serine endopeptidase [Zoogloea sp.]MDD2669281.1 Do family serine endopeptidase [Zoogloea sp.]MDY0037476.1 Do family serine endopeptidase [Zoogloea oleivorans]